MSVAGPDLDDEFGKDEFVEEFGGDEPSEPWHNSTRAVVGASAIGMAVIGVLIAAIMFMTRQDDSPTAPADIVDPSFSATAAEPASSTTTTTTTETITSTPPLSTTEINGPSGPPTSSDTSGSSTSSSESPPPATIRTRDNTDENGPTRKRGPRFNITRTFPQPIG